MSIPHRHPRRHKLPVEADFGNVSLEKIGVSAFDWRDPYHLAVTLSWPRFFMALFVLYMLVNMGFGALYLAVPGCISNMRPGSLMDAFFFSVETLATVGYGVMAPSTLYGHLVSYAEIFVGMVLTATMTGLVFVRFSKAKSKILFADRVVLSRSSGKPMLMIRIGNGRMTSLHDAQARVTVLVVESAPDGQTFRRAVDLKLVREDFPFFPMVWTLMHEIGEDSPLAGLHEGRHTHTGLRMFVSISARDPSLASQVYAMKSYGLAEVARDMHYVDLVSWDGQDHSIADMRKLSLIEPDHGVGAQA